MTETIERRDIRTLDEFYELMGETREVRVRIVEAVLGGGPVAMADFRSLEAALAVLGEVPTEDGRRVLRTRGGAPVTVELGYEVNELAKDLLFLAVGEEGFVAHLAALHEGFSDEVARGVERLSGKRFNGFVTDRDGTINNYCGRYRSSVQSAWNAVMLTRFARACTEHPVVLSSAPLRGLGLAGLSVVPEGAMTLAGSKGREFLDREGRMRTQFAPSEEEQALLDRLNAGLDALLARPGCRRFALIGSGLQHKLGQTTVARQDIHGSVPEAQSAAWLADLEALVREVEPEPGWFSVVDTGLDVELAITLFDGKLSTEFDKAAAVPSLAANIGLDLSRGPHLVCGDTGSDMPMLEAVAEHTPDTWTVFVTREEELTERVRGACDRALFVSTPDTLVALLGTLAELQT